MRGCCDLLVNERSDVELGAAIGRLRKSDQEVIRRRARENLTAAQIADVLGCSVSAAKKRISRAFNRLDKTLTDGPQVDGLDSGDDPPGDAGVREPRRPRPSPTANGATLDVPE